jgi:hypothetical protein
VPDPKPKAVQPEAMREAVTQTVLEVSKENVAPPTVVQQNEQKEVKEKKVRRDPMKLKEMEQRLL